MEYALLTSTLALALGNALGGVSGALPATAKQVSVAVTKTALAANVPPAQARRALARAPYKRQSLRYLYAAGWIAGKRDRITCAFVQLNASAADAAARLALSRIPGRAKLLRRARLTERAARTAVARGFRAACGAPG
ncbi:MAG: hypothetical protein OEV72_03010 [Thermoleophilia bacterium]|nr:hypothetical protein [Thermoleophilia bacterium]